MNESICIARESTIFVVKASQLDKYVFNASRELIIQEKPKGCMIRPRLNGKDLEIFVSIRDNP